MFTVATNALKTHPQMKNVIVLEHAPRHDVTITDPTQLKSKLAKFANTTLTQLWHSSNMKDRIIIGKHSLDYTENMLHAIYKDDWSGRYDGVHMYGSHGKGVYTRSVLQILKKVLPSPGRTPSSSSPSHSHCEQAQFQKSQEKKQKASGHQQHKNAFSVPVSNRFEVLGN